MKNNKLLAVIILVGFLSFGMKYNTIIKNNFVAPIVERFVKAEKTFIDEKKENKDKKAEIKEDKTNTSTVAATVTVANAVAVNGGGNAQPGSQLDFTITITNTGTDDALGMNFQDILDSNLTLVPNSFKATPIANNNSYSCIGNVGISVDAAGGVLTNDVSPDGTALSASLLTGAANGTAVLNANGSFIYNPNAGYSGSDSFTYTLTTASGKTSTATVNITVSTPIIFVNSAAAAAGNGTLASPYKTLNSITGSNAFPVFIYMGTVTGLLTLNDNQKVIGQGAAASLTSILSLAVPAYSNVLPATGGTNPTIAGVNLKANNDIQAVALTGTLSGSNVGALKIRNTTINTTNLQAVNITGGGALDCIFTSISASGVSKGISVSGAQGSFQVTGTGSTAGSGGTIQNISLRGAEFISCANVTLKNMNFTNANNSSTVMSDAEDDNTNSYGALHFKTVSGGVNLDNILITGTTNSVGINLNDVNNFVLSNSTITGCGSANGGNANVGGIFALNLRGTSSITNTNVNDSWGRGFFGFNGQLSQNPTLNLTVTGSQFKNSFNKSNGDSNFIFQAKGTTNNTLVFKKNDFSNSKTTGLALNFSGSSINTVQIGGTNASTDANTINAAASSPGSNGLSLQVTGNAAVNYNIINNTLKSSYNALYACSVGNQGSGTIKGRINNNTIDGGGSTSSSNGISVAAYGNAKHITEIANNIITNAANYGIFSEANDNAVLSAGRIDASITNNNISVANNAYTHIGVVAYADNASSTMISAAKVTGNIVNSASGLAAGNFDVLSQGPSCKVILQGNTAYVSGTGNRSAALTNFWNSNNPNTPTGAGLDEGGTGTIISGTVTIPDNASASKMAIQKETPQEEADPVAAVNNSVPDNAVTAKTVAANAVNETLTAGPFAMAAGKSTVITFSATINAAGTLPQNTCSVTNQAAVSGSNFTTVNSNITTTSIKPAIATVTADTENIPCLGSTAVTLNAACPLGTTATWYTAMNGGTSFATGNSVSATPMANNTTYCVACETAYCASDRVLVKTVTGTPSTTSPPVTVTECDSYTWSVNGTTYTSSGTYTAVVGCDTKTLNLTITPSATSTPETITACDSYTWSANGTTYTTSGTYTAVVGCDTKTLNLTINPSTSSATETVSRCDSYTWPVNGTTYTATGNYTHTIGCDTKTLALTITNSTSSTQTETACGSYTWPVNGTTYTASGNYSYSLGCDTKTLALTITNSTSSTQTETACDSYTWPVNGTTYTASGNYSYSSGCDTKTLALTITNSTSSTQTETACDSYTWPVNGTTYTASGNYSYSLGCDIKTLALTINNSSAIQKTVALNSGILTSDHSGAIYQWYKCPNTLLANETSQSFTPSSVGDYKVEITVAGCTIVSDCITVSTLGLYDFKAADFKMYPVPSKGILNILTRYDGNYSIIDAAGKIVKSINLNADSLNTIHLENLSDGVFLIKKTDGNSFKAQKFILKK